MLIVVDRSLIGDWNVLILKEDLGISGICGLQIDRLINYISLQIFSFIRLECFTEFFLTKRGLKCGPDCKQSAWWFDTNIDYLDIILLTSFQLWYTYEWNTNAGGVVAVYVKDCLTLTSKLVSSNSLPYKIYICNVYLPHRHGIVRYIEHDCSAGKVLYEYNAGWF